MPVTGSGQAGATASPLFFCATSADIIYKTNPQGNITHCEIILSDEEGEELLKNEYVEKLSDQSPEERFEDIIYKTKHLNPPSKNLLDKGYKILITNYSKILADYRASHIKEVGERTTVAVQVEGEPTKVDTKVDEPTKVDETKKPSGGKKGEKDERPTSSRS